MEKRIVRMYKFPFIVLIQFFVLQAIVAKPLAPNDFAFSAPLSEPKSNTNASLRQVVLPVSVYEKMQRSDYGDLRVFSADGQVVPHQFKVESSVSGTQEIPLTFYPFTKEEAANPANIRVIIDQKAGRQRLDINQQLGHQAGGSKPPVSKEFQYIIETVNGKASRKLRLCKLKLNWEQLQPSMILPFSLESSDNLQNWRSLGRSLNVSNLSYSGSQLLRNEVNFSCTTQKYLRLTWRKPQQQIHLKKVSGILSQGSEQKIQWKTLAKPEYDKDGNWLFESDVVATLTRMEFVAPQNGLLYKGALSSRNDKKSPWRFRQNISQYRLNVGENGSQTEQKSSPFSLRSNSDRYWKFQPENEGRLNESQLPEIRGGWQQQQLVYLAQGSAPFKLSFGNPNVKPIKGLDLTQVIQGLEKSGISPEIVLLGELIEAKNYREASNIPWKKIGLWAFLLLGTAVLGFMALSLSRQMKRDKKSEN